MKIFCNFLLYYNNKIHENNSAFVDLDNQQKIMKELIEKKESMIATIGAATHTRESKLELQQKVCSLLSINLILPLNIISLIF